MYKWFTWEMMEVGEREENEDYKSVLNAIAMDNYNSMLLWISGLFCKVDDSKGSLIFTGWV